MSEESEQLWQALRGKFTLAVVVDLAGVPRAFLLCTLFGS